MATRTSPKFSRRVAGLTHAAELSQVALLPEELAAQTALFPQGQARPGFATGRSARPQFLAADCSPKFRPSNCWKPSSSMPSRLSF